MSDKSKKNIDPKPIKDLAKILEELNLTEVSYSDGDFSVTVAKGARLQPVDIDAPIQNKSEIQLSEDDYKNDPRVIKSPMVGTVYLQPEPGANKFVNIGDSVKSGQTILIVEAMKTMNPIESSLQGKVIKILVENEQAVEFGQPLMLIG
jgi:acetyl-CoA carboxylase biotin carboxyl carrier protein